MDFGIILAQTVEATEQATNAASGQIIPIDTFWAQITSLSFTD